MFCFRSSTFIHPSRHTHKKIRFYALSIEAEDETAKASLIRAAGNKWAQKAEYLLLANFGKVSVQRLMVSILPPSLNATNFDL
jgi:hypothetical protein